MKINGVDIQGAGEIPEGTIWIDGIEVMSGFMQNPPHEKIFRLVLEGYNIDTSEKIRSTFLISELGMAWMLDQGIEALKTLEGGNGSNRA